MSLADCLPSAVSQNSSKSGNESLLPVVEVERENGKPLSAKITLPVVVVILRLYIFVKAYRMVHFKLVKGSSKKQESPIKTAISALLTMPKPLTVWITINCGKF